MSWKLIGTMFSDESDNMGFYVTLLEPDDDGNYEMSPQDAFKQASEEVAEMGYSLVKRGSTGGGSNGGGQANLQGQVISLGSVVCRTQMNAKDSTTTPIIDLYKEWNDAKTNAKWPVTKIYLNNDSDVETFEKHTGLKLADLAVYGEGAKSGALERTPGMVSKFENELAIPVKFRVVFKPKYENGVPAVKADGSPAVYTNFDSWV